MSIPTTNEPTPDPETDADAIGTEHDANALEDGQVG